MSFLAAIIGVLIPGVRAATLEQLGAGGEGVSGMWQQILSVFPHTGVGSQGPLLILLKVTSFVLTMIGGSAVAVIVYGGIRMTMYTLDEAGFAETKRMVGFALLGVVLALAADAIVLYAMQLITAAAGG